MPSLSDFAQQFQIDVNRPYFPVNSLRLLYFMMADHYLPGNSQVTDQINRAIPLVEAVASAKSDEGMQNLAAVVASPKMKQAVEHYHATLVPLQSNILAALYQDFTHDGPLSEAHLTLLLHTRALDSYLYAVMLVESVQQFAQLDEAKLDEFRSSTELELSQIYQLNDLVDSIVYAKDDIQSDNFSPLQMMRKIAPQPQDTKELIKKMQEKLTSETTEGPASVFQAEIAKLLQ